MLLKFKFRKLIEISQKFQKEIKKTFFAQKLWVPQIASFISSHSVHIKQNVIKNISY